MPFDDAFDDPYRVVCPKGHSCLRRHGPAGTVYCLCCLERYDVEELQDRKVTSSRRRWPR